MTEEKIDMDGEQSDCHSVISNPSSITWTPTVLMGSRKALSE